MVRLEKMNEFDFNIYINNAINKISLHVFAHNKRALSLYEKTGFIATDINMSKNI